MNKSQIYTVEQLLAVIPISRTGLYKAIANNQLASFRYRRRRYFTTAAVQNFVNIIQGVTHG